MRTRGGGVLTPPALHELVGGWQLAASWARARASRSWHSCWHARQTPTATCSHPPTSAGAAGPSGFPGLPAPLPRAQEPPPQSPPAPSLLPACSSPRPWPPPSKTWGARRRGTEALEAPGVAALLRVGEAGVGAGRAGGGRGDREADRPTDRVRAPPATWRRSSGTMAGSAVPGSNCRQTNLKR